MSFVSDLPAEIKIKRALAAMTITQPFYACLMNQMILVEDSRVETMAVDSVHLYFNRAYVDSLTESQLIGVFAHETRHVSDLHCFRRGNREPLLWNIACDKKVNRVTLQDGFTLPPGLIPPEERFDALSVENVYAILFEEREAQRKASQPQPGQPGQGQGQPGQPGQGQGQPGQPGQGQGQPGQPGQGQGQPGQPGQGQGQPGQPGQGQGQPGQPGQGQGQPGQPGQGQGQPGQPGQGQGQPGQPGQGQGQPGQPGQGQGQPGQPGQGQGQPGQPGQGQGQPGQPGQGQGQPGQPGQGQGQPGQPGQGQGQPGQPGQGQGQPDSFASYADPGRCGGVLDAPLDAGKSLADARAETEMMVRQAIAIAKAGCGDARGNLLRITDSLNASHAIDWREQTESFIDDAATRVTDWSRPNKRFTQADFYMPRQTKDSVSKLALLIDSSGSVNDAALGAFQTHAQDMLNRGRVECIVAVYCDTEVRGTQKWQQGETIKLDVKGGGGTDMRPGIKYIEDEHFESAAIVCLTDLDWPESRWPREPSMPVLWAAWGPIGLNPRTMVPFGKLVPIDPHAT